MRTETDGRHEYIDARSVATEPGSGSQFAYPAVVSLRAGDSISDFPHSKTEIAAPSYDRHRSNQVRIKIRLRGCGRNEAEGSKLTKHEDPSTLLPSLLNQVPETEAGNNRDHDADDMPVPGNLTASK